MLVSIRHATHYSYDAPARSPCSGCGSPPSQSGAEGARLVDRGGGHRARRGLIDGFGNRVHLVTHCRPYEALTITAVGKVETSDTGGMVGDLGEAANPRCSCARRRSPPPREIRARRRACRRPNARPPAPSARDDCRAGRLRHRARRDPGTSAAEALVAGQGVCQDHAHIFIAAARRIGVRPAT